MNIPTLDRCPGYNLYIGGFIALRRPQALKNANITHIVSVLDWKFDDDVPLIRGYQHLHIPVDDVEDENLLEWFPRSNAFIQAGLDYWKTQHPSLHKNVDTASQEGGKGSGVLIHCAMGKSRSATILLAYLLWSSRHKHATTSMSNLPSQQQEQQQQPQQSPDDPDMISLPTKPLTVIKALEILRRGRPIAEPNEGFMDQLHMYEDMGCPTTEAELKRHKIYRRWMNKRSVQESLSVNMAPEMAAIKFEDESEDEDEAEADTKPEPSVPNNNDNTREIRDQGKIKGKGVTSITPGIKAPDGSSDPSSSSSSKTTTTTAPPPSSQAATVATPAHVTLKCRKCRHNLATTPFLVSHIPPPHTDPSFQAQHTSESQVVGSPSSKCAHIFLHPLSWMRPVLSEGQLEGRLSCPKCSANIGKFAWQGLRCSCGGWVTPGFGIARGKVDEVVSKGGLDSASAAGGGALRLPPGMRRGGGNL